MTKRISKACVKSADIGRSGNPTLWVARLAA